MHARARLGNSLRQSSTPNWNDISFDCQRGLARPTARSASHVCKPAGFKHARLSTVTHSQPKRHLIPPDKRLEVDDELWGLLDICSNEELEEIHNILFGGSFLSPLVKSIVADNEPAAIHLRGRTTIMHRIESRFRFLAADATSTLRGQRPTYRQALLCVRDRLQVSCPGGLATQDLETEIYVHMLQRQAEAMQTVADSLDASKGKVRAKPRSPGDVLGEKLRDALRTVQMAAPEMSESLIKAASALGMGSLKQSALRQVGSQLILQRARYQAALSVACKSGAPLVQREATIKAAQAGLTSAAARYGTIRGAFSLLGPIMWTWFAADLALQSIGTDFQRVTKAVYALAQIRLLRTHGFINPA